MMDHLQLRALLKKAGLRVVASRIHSPGGEDATLRLYNLIVEDRRKE